MSGNPALEEGSELLLDFNKGDGLIPVIVQDFKTKKVLMLAYANKEALQKTVETKKAHFFSRSRNQLWLKGESSGNIQEVKEILIDCDQDAVIYGVKQIGGAACHTGHQTCFYRILHNGKLKIQGKKVFDPNTVYSKTKK